MTLRQFAARGAAALLLAAAAPLAFAHAHPTERTPGAGATAPASTTAVTIDFDEGLEPAFSSIKVTDAAGQSVTRGKSSVGGDAGKRMSVALAALKPGVYTVHWVAVATDGHRTQGTYTFTVQ
ncbi:copper resistance protein CopC [Burkholderia glumae]|uniref:Copper resistance protein CopC n=1 Tax=Burkholderia glumae TaxID=337 RepID=A0AAP9XW68_BURGL|nr:copper resistance protein CopC [Burkholderia glumae]ACR31851.1 Copper resistance protein CopC [Burkholderia glumae BGR1]AJY62651.1 copC domain protein [Burkholderia glumae LMG 2196 = ATCC 33617]KHJ60111.1 copper resistance protein [Burkholderia glumae]MCM2484970.1 copper resistance protein CopC [Burkholderia glumae]MCM2495323.1 copper resistance protein CopC [Burkholderia glumae]